MSEAILVQEASKTFGRNPLPAWKRAATLLPERAAGPGVVALDQVSFDVAEGEVFGIVGSQGAGKSTLVRLIAALLLPDTGHIQVFGQDVGRQPGQRLQSAGRLSSDFSAAFQPLQAGGRLSALEHLVYTARLYGLDGGSVQARQQMLELLRFLGLEEPEIFSPAQELSAVAQFKLALARLLLIQPRLLLLDDPLSGRPEGDKQEILNALSRVNRQLGVTLLFFSRDLPAAADFCHRLARLENGRLQAVQP